MTNTREENAAALAREEANRMSNPWQLYDSHAGWQAATVALNKAFETAFAKMVKAIATGTPLRDAERLVYLDMDKVMHKYDHLGAMDSEPRHHLEYIMERRIKERFGR